MASPAKSTLSSAGSGTEARMSKFAMVVISEGTQKMVVMPKSRTCSASFTGKVKTSSGMRCSVAPREKQR